MANVTKIKLPSGDEYTIKDTGALPLTGGTVTGPTNFGNSVSIDEATIGDLIVNGNSNFTNGIKADTYNGGHPTYFIKGTQTASTNVWTGTLPDGVTYYNGLTIDYLLPYAGTSSAATLNLSGLGAKPVYYGNSVTGSTTTHYGANTVIHLTYVVDSAFNSGNGCWKASNYYDSNTVDRLRDSYFRPYAGEAIYRYKFVMQGADNRVYPITVTNQSDATQVAKVPTQVGLRPGRIWYYNTTTTVSAGAVLGASTLDSAYQTTIGVYNFNTDIAAYRMLYLRGTYNKTTDLFTLYKDSSSPCTSYYTQVPTNTANITLSSYFTSGYYYMLLGGTYSSANYISLFEYNPLYYFDGTNLIPVSTKVAQDINPVTTEDITHWNYAYDGYNTLQWNNTQKELRASKQGAMTTLFSQSDMAYNSSSNTTGFLTMSDTLSAAKLSGAIPSAVTATTQASTDNSTKIATTAYVTTAIANLPEPMLFKGSVGTGGTITSLPTAAAANEGWTYKVITALSTPVTAKVGDTVISNGSSWVVIPSGDEPSGTVTSVGISNGGGLSISGSPVTSSGTITVSHADTSSQASSSNSGRTYIQSVTLDTYGHVTGLSTATETVTNTDEKLKVAEVTSATQYYPLVGTGTTAANRQYDTTGLKYKGTTGTTSAVGSSILELGNSTASGTAGNKQGQIILYGTNAKKATITLAAPSADIALALPTSGGTLALTSQLPSVPTTAASHTTGITASTTATKTTLGTAFTIPNVTSAGSASTWTFEEKTIPNVTSAGSASSWTFGSVTVANSISGAVDSSDSSQLNITLGTTTVQSKTGGSNGSAPTLGTAIKVQSKSGGANSSAPTLGTAFTVPNVTGNTSATVSITDSGHTHSLS